MANIATLLARILTTRYGRDMRQDLHDSIELVNNDTETALGKKLTFTNNTRKLKLLAKDDTVLSEVLIPGGGSGGGSVDSVNGKTGDVVLDLDDLNNAQISSPTDGQVLGYDSTTSKWTNINQSGGVSSVNGETGAVVLDLDDIHDTAISSPTSGQVLKWNGSAWANANESGGGTTDYTDLTNKPSINGVALVGNKTSADLGISGGSNENLLDNPWFTVNQRGITSGSFSSTGDIYIDRWHFYKRYTNAPTFTVSSNGLTVSGIVSGTAGGYIRQFFEQSLIGKTVTFSVLYSDGTISNNTVPITGTAYVLSDGKVNLRYVDSGDYSLYAYFDVDCTVRAIKMEIGTQSTLAFDTAPDYASELLKCQRYYYPLGSKSYNAMVSPLQQTRQWFTITLPTEMRAVPTLSGSLVSEGILGSSSMTNTVTSSNITVTKTQDIDFNFTTSGNYNLCSCARVSFASGSYLSAEL